ncbi:MAG: FkbM family methyltransferase [Akkermansiaceae bacterium]|nr:FkbM family methyltransferase [Armatimonadota bacterium]
MDSIVSDVGDGARGATRRVIQKALRGIPLTAADSLYRQIKGSCRRLGSPPGAVETQLRSGGRMIVDLSDGQQRHIYYTGIYEHRFMLCLSRYLSDGQIFVDIGANVGAYTLFAAARVGSGGHVFAIEPNPKAFARLRQNVRLNEFGNCTLIEKAASDHAGSGAMLPAFDDLAVSRLVGGGNNDVRPEQTVTVALETLDTCLGERADSVQIIKADAEGAELQILRGAPRTLYGRPYLLLEVDDKLLKNLGSSQEEVLAFLRDLQYKSYEVDASGRLTAFDWEKDRNIMGSGHHNLFFVPEGKPLREEAGE